MDFAPEPVLDAFTPPPTRTAPRAAVADDNGQTFDDHLNAVNEPPAERPAAAQNEAKDDAAPVAAKPTDEPQAEDETIDPDVALLGGPAPQATPAPMAAPVIVQIAASQPDQQQTQPQNADVEAAPVTAPQAPAPVAPDGEAAAANTAPVEQSAPVAGKHTQTEVKPAANDARQAQPPTQTAQQGQGAPQQPQPAPANTAVDVETLPQAVRDAIAATVAPAPQSVTQTVQRQTRTAQQTGETEATTPKDGKTETPAPTVNVKAQTPKAVNGAGNALVDAAPAAPQALGSAPDGSQTAQSNAITTTASQASTHVQHAAVDTGAQRAAPAGAQVAREIIRHFNGGATTFELRLDPAELGRVEVRMEVTRDHRVTAVITADNPQALTELARHARDLEQQLQSAGLQLGENGLSFDLRQGAQDGETNEVNNGARGVSGETALSEQQPAPVARPIGYERWRGVRVDMMV